MALIVCSDCGKQVSDAAAACIHCGRPLRAQRADAVTVENDAARPVLIEASARRYKRNMLVGLAGIPVGFVVMLLGGAMTIEGLTWLGLLVAFIGIVWFILNTVARWYHHA